MPDIPPTTSEGMLDDEALYEQQYGDDDADDTPDIEAALERGECPWCDDGPFDRPEMHARQKHEEEWSEYRDG